MTTPDRRTVSPRSLATATLLPLVLLLPFVNKAFHIDDPLQLWTAEHLQKDPVHFYSFDVNWYGFEQPMHEANQNPPGTAYILAAAAGILGWGEAGLHLVMACIASVAGVGIWLLANRLCRHALLATALSVCTPAFLVSANTVMTDIPLLAAWIWAIVLWLGGLEHNSAWRFFLAGIFMSLAIAVKYFGIALIPLLLVYTVVREKRIGLWALYLLLPLAFLAAYETLTHAWFGKSLFLDAFDYTRKAADASIVFRKDIRSVTSVTYMGAGAASVFLLAPFVWRGRSLLVGLALMAAAGGILWMQRETLLFMVHVSSQRTVWIGAQVLVWFMAGAHILALTIADARRHKNAESLLLGLWVWGTLLFAAFLNWSITARSLLPIVPAAAILAVRVLRPSFQELRAPARRLLAIPLALAMLLGLSVVWADYSLANSGKRAAQHLAAQHADNPRALYYEGHWGFQYYMKRMGLAYFVDDGTLRLLPGDSIAVPLWSSVIVQYNTDVARIDDRRRVELPVCRWLATMHPQLGAGFYSHTFGPLPFTFGPVPPMRYDVYVLGNYRQPTGAPTSN